MQSDCSDQRLTSFIKELGFEEFSQQLVSVAFTHSSYTKEHNLPHNACYERLEFLGDAILKMVVTEYLYNKYPDAKEGDLTKVRAVVISDEMLFKAAQKLNIEPYIIVGTGEEKSHSQKLKSIQACVMEALFGALYISSDKNKLKDFILNCLLDDITDIMENDTVYNAKAILQEYTQKDSKSLPVYNLVNESGAAHNKTFTISVSYKGKILSTASGKTKKSAEQEAAYIACSNLGLIVSKDKQK